MHIEFLKSITFFKNLSDNIISLLNLKVNSASFKKGEIIFSENEEARAILFVESGIVKIKKVNFQGKEFIVCMKRSGNLFAETSVFCERGSTLGLLKH